ncbi:MAG: hypothetical protein ABJF10_07695 [Chthoniobacter sp.]|uniref:anti-sigma factor family protein n=1 Tax=Chthoniobacter sp. TaxID=2510640 RepID=UPI0032A90B39
MSSVPADHESPHWLKARIAGVVWRITPNCHEVTRLASEELDHPLPFTTRTRLGLHRLFCEYCARYTEQLELLHEASRRLPEHPGEIDSPTLNVDFKARLKRTLREHSPAEQQRP